MYGASVHVISITFQTGLGGLYGVSVHVILITFQTGLPGLYGVSVHVILITFQTGLLGLYGVSVHVILITFQTGLDPGHLCSKKLLLKLSVLTTKQCKGLTTKQCKGLTTKQCKVYILQADAIINNNKLNIDLHCFIFVGGNIVFVSMAIYVSSRRSTSIK